MEVSLDGVNILDAINTCVSSVSSAYSMFLSSIVGEFRKSISSNITYATVREFDRACLTIQNQSLKVIDHVVNDNLEQLSSVLSQYKIKRFSKVKKDITRALNLAFKTQMTLDISAARSDVYRYTLAVLNQTKAGKTHTSAIVIANKFVKFNFIDRSGKIWNSDRYIATATRGELVRGVYFSFVLRAEKLGFQNLKLSNDEVVSILDIDKYIHPNSKLMPIQLLK